MQKLAIDCAGCMLDVWGDGREVFIVEIVTELETEGLTIVSTVERFLLETTASKSDGLADGDDTLGMLVGLLVERVDRGSASSIFSRVQVTVGMLPNPTALFFDFDFN